MTIADLQHFLTALPPETEIFVEYDGSMEPLSAARVVGNALALFHDGYGSDPDWKDWSKEVEYAQNELRSP